MSRADEEIPQDELDLLIAEQVMGWVRNRFDKLWPDRSSFGYRNSRGHGLVPSFSRDMGQAWQVIESLRRRRIRLESLSNRPGDYVCTLVKLGSKRSDGTLYTARSHEPARAICLAALKALPPMRRQASLKTEVPAEEKPSPTGASESAKPKRAKIARAKTPSGEKKLKSGRSLKKTRFKY